MSPDEESPQKPAQHSPPATRHLPFATCAIGVDVGGTKTQAVLVNSDGQPLAWGMGGPGNPTRIPVERMRASFRQAISQAVAGMDATERRTLRTICLGAAGASGRDDLIRNAVQDVLDELGLDARIAKIQMDHAKVELDAVQAFQGTVISMHGNGASSSFTVRRIASHGIGVERTFPLYSPRVEKVEISKRARVRRAKLYYLRERRGKQARLRAKRTR